MQLARVVHGDVRVHGEVGELLGGPGLFLGALRIQHQLPALAGHGVQRAVGAGGAGSAVVADAPAVDHLDVVRVVIVVVIVIVIVVAAGVVVIVVGRAGVVVIIVVVAHGADVVVVAPAAASDDRQRQQYYKNKE